MPLLKIVSFRFGWSFTKQNGYFRIKTKEHGWSPSTKLATAELVAAVGTLLKGGNAVWDTDAGAIIHGDVANAFIDAQDDFAAKAADGHPHFPAPPRKVRVL